MQQNWPCVPDSWKMLGLFSGGGLPHSRANRKYSWLNSQLPQQVWKWGLTGSAAGCLWVRGGSGARQQSCLEVNRQKALPSGGTCTEGQCSGRIWPEWGPIGLFQCHPESGALRPCQFKLQESDSKVISSFPALVCSIKAGSSFHYLEDLDPSLSYSSLVTSLIFRREKKTTHLKTQAVSW